MLKNSESKNIKLYSTQVSATKQVRYILTLKIRLNLRYWLCIVCMYLIVRRMHYLLLHSEKIIRFDRHFNRSTSKQILCNHFQFDYGGFFFCHFHVYLKFYVYNFTKIRQ